MALLELNNVTVSFPFTNGQPSLQALEGLSLSVERGELVALVGPSGCGKTTALNVLAGQVRPTQGQVRLAGEPRWRACSPRWDTSPRRTPCSPGGRCWTTWPWPWSSGASPRPSGRETARALMEKMGLGA